MKLKALIGHTAFSPIPGQRNCLCDLSGSFRMKEIQLNHGKVSIVDDEDFDFLNQWKWTAHRGGNTFYATRHSNCKSRKELSIHRIIMNCPEGLFIDHINHNGLDNQKANLRICTKRENCMNKVKKSSGGLVGAYKKYRKFYSRIQINGKTINLGYFKTAEEAHQKYMNVIETLKKS